MSYTTSNSEETVQGFAFNVIVADEGQQPSRQMENGARSMVNDPMYNMPSFLTGGGIGPNTIESAWAESNAYSIVDPGHMLHNGGNSNGDSEGAQQTRHQALAVEIPLFHSGSNYARLEDISPHISGLPNFPEPNDVDGCDLTDFEMLSLSNVQGSPLTPISPFTSSQESVYGSPYSGSGRGRSRQSSFTRFSPYGRQRSLSASRSETGMMGGMNPSGMGNNNEYSHNSDFLQVPHTPMMVTAGGSAPVTPSEYYSPLPYTDDNRHGTHSAGASPISPLADVRDIVGSTAITESTMSRRTREARFHCPRPDCRRSFTARHNLTNHMNSHLNQRNHHCRHMCGGSFVTSSVKRRHERTCRYQAQPSPNSSNGSSQS